MLVVTLLVACTPGEPAPSAEEIAAAVETSVAMTVEAQGEIATSVALTVAAREAEAAAAQPLPTATQTPTPQPLPTLTPVMATATPFTVAPSSGGGGGGGGTTYSYSCDIIRQRPQDNTEFKRTHTFDVSFVILNTGTETWAAGKDVVLLGDPGGALGIAPGTLVYEIPAPGLKPGETTPVIGPFDATAPDEPGHYVIDFKVEGGICYPYVAFNVVR